MNRSATLLRDFAIRRLCRRDLFISGGLARFKRSRQDELLDRGCSYAGHDRLRASAPIGQQSISDSDDFHHGPRRSADPSPGRESRSDRLPAKAVYRRYFARCNTGGSPYQRRHLAGSSWVLLPVDESKSNSVKHSGVI